MTKSQGTQFDDVLGNGHLEKVQMLKLTCDNWTEWKKFFKDLLVGRGCKEIFDLDWCKKNVDE